MKKLVCMVAVTAAVSMLGVRAEDEIDDLMSAPASDGESGEVAASAGDASAKDDAGDGAEGLAVAKSSKEKHFHLLPFCRRLDIETSPDRPSGKAEVLTPMASAWAPVKEGKFYPLGSTYRTTGDSTTRLQIQFGPDVEVVISGNAEFGTRAQALAEKSRTITLGHGTIDVKLPRNFPEGLFVVTAPGFRAVNLAGESRYTQKGVTSVGPGVAGDGDDWLVRCVTGSLTVEGRHFRIPSMKAAQEVDIRTSQDILFTGIYGKSGDYIVKLDQGRILVKDFETGENKIEDKVLDWKLSPQTAIRIHRAVPAIGERMSVTIMTFDAAGELKNRCAFTEKTVEVNSGELGPTSKKDREEIAKKAAEATETVAADGGESETTESGETAEEGSATEEKSDAGTASADADLEF